MAIERTFSGNGMKSLAVFSEDGKHRYALERSWSPEKGKVVFIGLNPSTADEMKNDPTVSRMISFSKSWGFGEIGVCNLFSFRATFPEDMKKFRDPVGAENDFYIAREISDADRVVACWGNHGKFLNRSSEVTNALGRFEHFGFTKQGEPRHILYLRSDSPLEIFQL